MRILRRGDTGADVRLAQTALTRAGYDPGRIDGVFGVNTERAVKQFQRVLGAREDGIIGPVTWQYLEPFALEPDPDVLRRGSRGEMVEVLQRALDEAGFDPGVIDGLFGTRTQAALKAFQKAVGLNDTGVADMTAWLMLAPFIDYSRVILRLGDSGVYVTILQSALINAGYSPGSISGSFDSATRAAVVAFQRANNLTPDGIVGRRTWAALAPYLTNPVITYTVQRGDTLSALARRFNTTVDAIVKMNNIQDPNLIRVGEVLYIPVMGGQM